VVLYSVLNFLRDTDIVTSFQQTLVGCSFDVYFLWGTSLANSWFKEDILASLGDVSIEWVYPSTNDDQSGIVAVHLVTPGGVVVLD